MMIQLLVFLGIITYILFSKDKSCCLNSQKEKSEVLFFLELGICFV